MPNAVPVGTDGQIAAVVTVAAPVLLQYCQSQCNAPFMSSSR